ncbi:Acetyltransferase (GNAT) domain-containing protein [Paenimyroides ummariense]|uniref:Acetyltransferase (GNAT) domain-containing protein n=1 Tax=Paenimyroides ummariense TaxID=913024 RepID=A0A1I5EY89_9FLAO|nr:GNAT family N-acetyltransferase [Paenimyroides ummariense]SFO16403.1 Acetyltransferase (GNAT) domain-containing protein [Paenimyroides ummariense]
MDIRIEKLSYKNLGKIKDFIGKENIFTKFSRNKLEFYIYSRYYINGEISKTTHTYAAYLDKQLAGFLLATIDNKPKQYNSKLRKIYTVLLKLTVRLLNAEGLSVYHNNRKLMLSELKKNYKTEGELNLLAIEPLMQGTGIGTALLNKFQEDQKEKNIFLFTDSGPQYKFYIKEGFEQGSNRLIFLENYSKKIALTYFICTKKL